MTSNLPELFRDMTLKELVAWTRGDVLIAIGANRYDSAIYQAISTAWTRGYESAMAQAEADELRRVANAALYQSALEKDE